MIRCLMIRQSPVSVLLCTQCSQDNASSLERIPFYAIAGNHDHGGNVTAQIAYSQNPHNVPLPGGMGGRWKYPTCES